MQPMPLPLTRDLVLVGGGHTHALVLRQLAMAPLPGLRVTLVNPLPDAPYTGMLPGHVAGHYPRADLEMDLVKLARLAGARLVLDRAVGLQDNAILLANRPALDFDVASIDIGISSALPDVPGFMDNGVAAKPLGDYAARWAEYVARVKAGQVAAQIVILGAGVAGVELALSMDHRLRAHPRQITVIERDRALPHLGRAARGRLLAEMARVGISLIEGAEVAQVVPGAVHLADGREIPATLTLGAAGSRPQGWLAGTGLDLTEGYITVGPTLQSVTRADVFAVGDCAHMQHAPRPKAGVFAVRQAPVLYHNLIASLSGQGGLRAYHPQRDYLKLISLGDRRALADKWGLPQQGAWLWRLKHRIDVKFMRMFHDLAPMPRPAPPARAAADVARLMLGQPLCGGCGAKLGAAVLATGLRGIDPDARADDAAVITTGGAVQVLASDHLRALTGDPWLMGRIAANHALGDLWAMGARGQGVLVNLTLPPQSQTLAARELADLMAGIRATCDAAGLPVLGGHTAFGAELTVGLTVAGLLDGPARTKGGGRPGDALILTKPLGSGTLLAGEMALRAQGRDIAALWHALVQSQRRASEILTPVAQAMTDVTGFGLAGHLAEMLRAGPARGALLRAGALPLMSGARDLAAAGVASVLAAANRDDLDGLRVDGDVDPAVAALCLDPQTAGGLLAAVPRDLAPGALAALRAAGYQAAVIGELTQAAGIDLRP
jgi:selenide,water dikinase